MKFFSKIKENLFSIFQTALIVLLIVSVIVFVGVLSFEYVEKHTSELLDLPSKNETLKFLGIGMGGVLVALQALMSYKRAKAMEQTAEAQADAARAQADAVAKTEQGQRQDRLKNAIEHLGHESDSVRLGGAYELFHLAEDTEDLRQTVLDILCAHIRQTTGESKYRETHKSEPSEETQSLLTLLFVQDYEVFKGCHINLQGSWLNGADLKEARLEGAILNGAHLQKADLFNARLKGAVLPNAHLQGAILKEAHLQGAILNGAHLQKAILWSAHLQGANLHMVQLHGAILRDAHLQEAGLNGTYLQGADLSLARMQMASLSGAYLQGANLHMAQLHGAILRDTQMQGVYLRAAQLHEAQFSSLQGLQHLNATIRQEINPERAQLQGVGSSAVNDLEAVRERLRKRTNKETDLSGVVLSGGLTKQDVNSLVADLSEAGARKLREILEPHIDQPTSHELPEDSGAITGMYTEEEAEQWIAEWEEAMSEVLVGDS
ncbi:MAG: pentapeptide repeat-containing protein [Gemmatimonadetes bacterium]|nr:pentapeptide repeat-containing protein [Gemmatimonadota bacterium]